MPALPKFMCPYDGTEAAVRSILTSGGERQAVVCEQHGPLVWIGLGRVDNLNPGGIQASYRPGIVDLDDLQPGEYSYVASGTFKGVWGVHPPTPDAQVVIVPTWAATFKASNGVLADDPALVITQPLTGKWRGRLTGGVWYPAPDLI